MRETTLITIRVQQKSDAPTGGLNHLIWEMRKAAGVVSMDVDITYPLMKWRRDSRTNGYMNPVPISDDDRPEEKI